MCESEFEHSKYLFGEDITKNISKAKDMSKLKKHLTKDYSKSSPIIRVRISKNIRITHIATTAITTKSSIFNTRAGTHKMDPNSRFKCR